MKLSKPKLHHFLLLCLFKAIPTRSDDAEPFVMPWNNTHTFGYDGPWYAVPVEIGNPPQPLNLFPGGAWTSTLISKNLPFGDSSSGDPQIPNNGGIYDASSSNPDDENSSENADISFLPSPDSQWGAWNVTGVTGSARTVTDILSIGNFDPGISIPSLSIAAVTDATFTTPDNRQIPLAIGSLSLGQNRAQTFSLGDDQDPYIGNMISQWLNANGHTPSNSWGLHYGSAAMSIPPSLIFGGYDQSRVLGDVATYDSQGGNGIMLVTLTDISIGVASGGSPFSFQNKSGLLQGAAGGSNADIQLNPTVPGLYLPEDTCKGIASLLPVTFDQDLGFYLWNTDDPLYKKIVSSPAYLSFSFQQGGGSDNLEINVPFSLLNLTLTPPLSHTYVPYFPCVGMQPAGESTNAKYYHLGRAFLQAAFIGMNWNTTTFWLAQAPGPGAVTQSTKSIGMKDESIEALQGDNLWSKSWEGHWSPLAEDGTSSGSGLSVGAKAGIGVGVALAGILLICGIWFFVYRRRQKQNYLRAQATTYVDQYHDSKDQGNPQFAKKRPELGLDPAVPSEIDGNRIAEAELESTRPVRSPQELPTD